MNRTLSQHIAKGRTAEVYPWEPGYVLKLYYDWCPRDWVDYEAYIAHAVYEAGVPIPGATEIVEVNERRGLVYERIEGISMLQDMNARPWTIFRHARALADLHVRIGRQSIQGLPSYKERLQFDIGQSQHLDVPIRERILERLQHLPDGDNLCHGDFHPGNVMITSEGPVVIDWMTACAGSPWLDMARTHMILSVGAKAAGDQVHPIIRMIIRLYRDLYVCRYRALMPGTANDMKRWLPIVAAARLNEEILQERTALNQMVLDGLNQ